MEAVANYLNSMALTRATGAGVNELSHYGALEKLLNAAGEGLKPKVRCVMNLSNQGAGMPDGGLFTSDQFQLQADQEPMTGQLPSRGAMEVKGTGDDAWQIAETKQVIQYHQKYGQVLVTNYRDFLLVGQDSNGKRAVLETYSLASDENDFWTKAALASQTAKEQGQGLIDFLRRVMLHPAPLATPEDLAWFLASYAREARTRIADTKWRALVDIRKAMEEALGVSFAGEKGDHFFLSTVVQTLFYGIFAAWVLWEKQHPRTDRLVKFDWKQAQWSLHVPMISVLFEKLATHSQLERLNLIEVLDWAGAALNRVDRASFFEHFDEDQAVQYFYEPFLEAFDPDLRKELGVWYTPPEIVKYMVERVDQVLRTEMDIPDGFADPRVYVLDPCCGTGAFLVEVVNRIKKTQKDRGTDALSAFDLKTAVCDRLYGFEILPAPFVIAHMQLGLALQNAGVPLNHDSEERAAVYLTNALTGWEPPETPKDRFMWPELEKERDAAEEIKQDKPILVVLGNPPYNAYAGVSPKSEQGLVEPYKEGLISDWGIKKFNLDDLYIRFFRLAERRIAEMTGQGIVCYISNFSYLDYPSFVVMRHRLLSNFNKLWFDCLNGDSRETGKVTPDGTPDPSVFSTRFNREGIQVGTAVGLMVKTETTAKPKINFRNFWGTDKKTDLLESLQPTHPTVEYSQVRPEENNRFSFRPIETINRDYPNWPLLINLCAIAPTNGLMEKRGGALIDIDQSSLANRMHKYFDPQTEWADLMELGTGLTKNAAGFIATDVRKIISERETYNTDRICKYAIRPFETRWCYYSPVNPLWNSPRPALWEQCWEGNSFLLSRVGASKTPEGPPFFYCKGLSDDHLLAPDASCFALMYRPKKTKKEATGMYQEDDGFESLTKANLSDPARHYLSHLGFSNFNADPNVAGLIWMHALAIGYSPLYLEENKDGIRRDWPRIPLPSSSDILSRSAKLGSKVSFLLDTETKTSRKSSREGLPSLGTISRQGGGDVIPEKGHLSVTAGWGHFQKNRAVMPGRGLAVERDYSPSEMDAIVRATTQLGLSTEQIMEELDSTTFDIYLNDITYWSNVPKNVWEYRIGGYQVIKKWLSYREKAILGRDLKVDEARYFTEMVRRITALILLQPALNENYERIKESTYKWPKATR